MTRASTALNCESRVDRGLDPTGKLFSSLCRQLRRAHSMLLKDQAAAFGVSISYVSAVETGRKGPVPDSFIQKFVDWLRLDDLTAERVRRAADASGGTKVLRSKNAAQARLLSVLGRSLAELSAEEIEALRQMVEGIQFRRQKENGDGGSE
ncbi:MAG: helix-turn-helix transcriptional regulator [Hyphomicrobiaceae bacterium]